MQKKKNSGNKNKYKKQLELFKNIMARQKDGNNMANDNGEINYLYEGHNEKEPSTYLIKYREYSLKEPIEKYIKKEFSNLKEENNENENKIIINEEENKLKENNIEEEIYEEGHYPKKEYEYVHDFEWNEDLEKEALEIINENNENVESLEEFLDIQNKNWEKFYKFNKTNFFK